MLQTMIIKSDSTMKDAKPDNGNKFTLQEMQYIVNGFIEILRSPGGNYMVVNEEGLLLDLPINKKATAIYREEFGGKDVIVGDVLICSKNQID